MSYNNHVITASITIYHCDWRAYSSSTLTCFRDLGCWKRTLLSMKWLCTSPLVLPRLGNTFSTCAWTAWWTMASPSSQLSLLRSRKSVPWKWLNRPVTPFCWYFLIKGLVTSFAKVDEYWNLEKNRNMGKVVCTTVSGHTVTIASFKTLQPAVRDEEKALVLSHAKSFSPGWLNCEVIKILRLSFFFIQDETNPIFMEYKSLLFLLNCTIYSYYFF